MAFGIIGWLLIGLVVGFIASKLVDLRGDDPSIGIVATMVGALAAGIAFAVISGRGVNVWDIWGLASAVGGAAAGAIIYHAIRSRSIDRTQKSVRTSY